MEFKVYRAMQRAHGKMLREYFSGVPVSNLCKRCGYSEKNRIEKQMPLREPDLLVLKVLFRFGEYRAKVAKALAIFLQFLSSGSSYALFSAFHAADVLTSEFFLGDVEFSDFFVGEDFAVSVGVVLTDFLAEVL